MADNNEEERASSFASLPWEEIVFGGANPESMANMTTFEEMSKKKKGKSKEGKSKGGWFSSNSHPRSSAADEGPGVVRKVSDHWLLKERKQQQQQQQQQQLSSLSQIQSMPPAVGTLRDSGIGEEGGNVSAAAINGHLSRNGTGRSSFGIVLKDKFQKNTRYLPHDGSRGRDGEEEEEEEDMSGSDDTLIHNMSEGSFEKEVNHHHHHHHHHHLANSSTGSNSLGHSSASPHNSMEGSPRMVAKAAAGPVSMSKKTIRNYTPKDGGNNMLRVIEDNRRRREEEEMEEAGRKTSVEKMIDDFHKNLPPPSTAANTAKNTARKGHHHGNDNGVDTLSSRVSAWSEASFDYQPASLSRRMLAANAMPSLEEVPPPTQALSPRVSPEGERIPPEGADGDAADANGSNFVHRIQVTAQVNTPPKSSSQNANNNGRGRSRKKDVAVSSKKKEKESHPIKEQVDNNEDEDEFANLHKLLREGRIAGLNEKPPSFVPPTPPSAVKKSSPAKSNGAAAKRRSSSKPPAPARPLTAQQRSQSQTREVGAGSPDSGGGGGRKKAAAPQPPGAGNTKTGGGGGGGSVEDLTHMDAPGRRAANRNTALVNGAKVRRTPSNHETKSRKCL